MTGDRPTLTVTDAAVALGVHENTVRNWVRRGHLDARVLPSGFIRPYADDVARLASGDVDRDELARLADGLDELAERLTRQSAALRDAAAVLRRGL